MKVLFVVSRLLGGNTFYKSLKQSVDKLEWVEQTWIFLDESAYEKYPDKIKFPFEAQRVLRRRYDAEAPKEFDVLFISGFELCLGLADIIKNKPTILAFDGTNLGAYQLLSQWSSSSLSKAMYWIKGIITKHLYKRVISSVDFFLPRSSWAENQITQSYKITPKKVDILTLGMDLEFWVGEGYVKKRQMLFVGNDFFRKGGHILIEVFDHPDMSDLNLIVVSNDKRLESVKLPDNINWIRGINEPGQLIDIYGSSLALLHPSRKDQLGLALIEALAMGLPIIATDVGGASDVVRHESNGFLMNYSDGPEIWRRKIRSLLNGPFLLDKFSERSRSIALESFSDKTFNRKIVSALKRIHICGAQGYSQK